jgi:hypothetical protein
MAKKEKTRQRAEARATLSRIKQGKAPTPEELAEAPWLHFWAVVEIWDSHSLFGVVTGHPNRQDGNWVVTSELLWLSPDEKSARTLSRFYRLGAPMQSLGWKL